MNIFEAKEAKIKSYLNYLNKAGATSKSKAVKIEDVERALKIDDRLCHRCLFRDGRCIRFRHADVAPRPVLWSVAGNRCAGR